MIKKTLFALTKILAKKKIPYMLTGALAVSYYGRPRATHDIDVVIEIPSEKIQGLQEAVNKFSSGFSLTTNEIRKAVKHKSHFNILHIPTSLKIDFWIVKDDPFDQSRFKRKLKVQIGEKELILTAPEDLILIKLLWFKESNIEKHLQDAASIYQVQKEKLDLTYLQAWTKKQSTQALLKKIEKLEYQKY